MLSIESVVWQIEEQRGFMGCALWPERTDERPVAQAGGTVLASTMLESTAKTSSKGHVCAIRGSSCLHSTAGSYALDLFLEDRKDLSH